MSAFDREQRGKAVSDAASLRSLEGREPARAHGGNEVWDRLALSSAVAAPSVQAKLVVGASDHPLEREAERAADAVLGATSVGSSPAPAVPAEAAARAPSTSDVQGEPASAAVEASVARGAGSSLRGDLRAFMELRFGADFSDVRVHEGRAPAALSGRLGARAFTSGRDVYFGAGESPSDRALLAHELAHVVQQTGAGDRRVAPAPRLIQRSPPTAAQVATLRKQLRDLIATATWPAIRAVEYARHSASAVQRAKDRRAKKIPDLTGIGTVVSADRFAAAAKSLQTDWSTLNAKERGKRLFDAANVELKAATAFELKGFDLAKLVSRGQFDPSAWKMTFQEATLDNASPTNDDIAQLANVALHEARHCEQHFLAARFEGAQPGKLAADIVKSQGIPGDVAIAAVQREKLGSKGLKGGELTRAESMFNSLIRDGSTNAALTNDTTTAIIALESKNTAAQTALKALSGSPSAQAYADGITARDELAAQKKAVEDAYGKYRAIPHEVDAHEVGDTAEVAYKAIP